MPRPLETGRFVRHLPRRGFAVGITAESRAELPAICRRRDGRAAQRFPCPHLRRLAARLQRVMEGRAVRDGGRRPGARRTN